MMTGRTTLMWLMKALPNWGRQPALGRGKGAMGKSGQLEMCCFKASDRKNSWAYLCSRVAVS
jgi:hypothetical protein